MQVPIRRRPDTSVVAREEGYARPAQGLDFSPIVEPVERLMRQLEDEQAANEKFDVDSRLIQETTALQEDYARREAEKPVGSTDFLKSVSADYETRHNTMLGELKKQGLSDSAVRYAAGRLAGLRQGVAERALGHQIRGLKALQTSTLEKDTVALTNYASTNGVAGYTSALQENEQRWASATYLDDVERLNGRGQAEKIIKSAARKSYALTNPEDTIALIDPQGLTKPQAAAAGQGGAYAQLEGWQGVPTTVASQLGLDPVEVAAVISFETGGTFDPDKMGGDGGRYKGLIQFGPEEQRTYGITDDSTPEQWSAAITKFMQDRGFKPGMGIEDFYSTILTGSPGNYDRQDSNGTSVRNAIPRILAEHKDNAEKWLRAAAPVEGASGIGTFDPGASTAPAQPAEVVAASPAQQAAALGAVRTGNPIIDDAGGEERLQMLAWAREQLTRKTVQVSGAMDVAVSNEVTANTNGIDYTGPTLSEDQVKSAYADPIKGEQQWAAVEQSRLTKTVVEQIKVLSPEEMRAKVESLRPRGDSPTLEQDNKFYQAAKAAEEQLLKARKDDPAAYVFSAFPEIASGLNAAKTPEDRRTVFAQMEKAFEQLGVPEDGRFYYTDEMIEQAGKQYKAAGAGKLDLLESWLYEMGDQAGRFAGRAVGSEVAEDFALYSILRGGGYGKLSGPARGVFQRVMAGKDLIEKDPARKPSSADINTSFAGALGTTLNSLNGDISRVMNEAAAALYVQKGGRTGKINNREQFDAKTYRAALREAFGGSAENEDTGLVDLSQGKVKDWTILPPGVTGTAFQNWVEQLAPGDLTKLSISGRSPMTASGKPVLLQDIIDEGVFVMRAPGIYGIKMEVDGKFLGNGTGKAFTIRLDRRSMGLR